MFIVNIKIWGYNILEWWLFINKRFIVYKVYMDIFDFWMNIMIFKWNDICEFLKILEKWIKIKCFKFII